MRADIRQPYLTQQLITYLGTKRKHLAEIQDIIDGILDKDPALARVHFLRGAVAADPFSGTGVVSRLLRAKGFNVRASDAEPYTLPINRTFLCTSPGDLEHQFESPAKWLSEKFNTPVFQPSYTFCLHILNTRFVRCKKYFRKYYAPQNTESPCFDTERLFYTQENAKRLDTWMTILHDPFWSNHLHARDILLAGVLVKMSTNINTSGAMKGFHKGWGGPNSDAVSRILSPMQLTELPLIEAPTAIVGVHDAACTNTHTDGQVDVVFLDPPAHEHQYSSSYHLLNSFCDNGSYTPGAVVRGNRAGIPPAHYRSDYCKRRAAFFALENLVEHWSAKSKYIVMCYDKKGILRLEDVFNLLQNNGTNKVDIRTQSEDDTTVFFIAKTRSRASRTYHRQKLATLDAAEKSVNLSKIHLCPIKLAASLKCIPVSSGWAVLSGNTHLFNVRHDYKVHAVQLHTLDTAIRASLKNAVIDEASLIRRYREEGQWSALLRVIKKMRLSPEKTNISQLVAEIYAQAALENNQKLITMMKTDKILSLELASTI